MRGERFAAPIFALLLVVSVVGAGVAPSPVGTAEAQLLGEGDCTFEDAWFEAVTLSPWTNAYEDNCGDVKELSEEWNETDADQTRTQIHSQAGQLAAGNEQFLTVQSNYLTDSNTIAWSKGEAAAVETLANGGTIAEAQSAANESIEDYYSIKQTNEIDRWDVAVETVWTLKTRGVNTTGVSNDFVTVGNETSYYGGGDKSWDATLLADKSTKTINLINGSSIQTTTLVAEDDSGTYSVEIGPTTGEGIIYNPDGGNDYGIVDRVKVRPTENLTGKDALNFRAFNQSLERMKNKSQSTKEEVAVYVNQSLGPAVQSGELNATSYISPATLAQEYSQEYGNDSSYIRATAMAAYAGMDAPDLNETGSMTVTHDGQTYTGLLLSQEAPSGGWQSGESYDPALLSGLQMIATAGDNSSIVELDGPFTVDKVTGTNGEEISKATTVNVTYETANTSEDYAELQQKIRTLNEQIEARKAQATSGTGGSSGPEVPKSAVVLVGLGAAAALLVSQRAS